MKLCCFVIPLFFSFCIIPVGTKAGSVDTRIDSLNILKGAFSGTIRDAKTGNFLQGVSISFEDIKRGGSTDSKGFFYIDNIPEGKHLIEISHIGYSTIAEYVDIIGDTKKDFILSESVVENNAVVVTGVTKATQLKKMPFQVSVLRAEDQLQNPSTNLIEGLTKKPGIASLSTGPAISKPVIRGLGYNRVLTINDGVRQEGQQWGDEHGIEIDEASISKVEILKGPASLIYGSDATAGVINIITNVPVENNTIKLNLFGNYQTNNNLKAFGGNWAGNIKGISWNIYGTNRAAADYQNKYDGKVFNSKFKEHNIGGYVGYNGNWGYSHLLLSNFDLKPGLVEGERDAAGYFIKPVPGGEERVTEADLKSTDPLIPYQYVRHFKIATDNNIKLGKGRLSVNVGFQHNQREEFGNVDDPQERALFFDLKTITYTAQLHLREMQGWKTSIGINGMQQKNKNKGVEQLIPDYDLFDIGGYVYTQKTIKKLTLSGGARYDTRMLDAKPLFDGNDIKGSSFSRTFSNFSGSAGAAYELTSKINLKLNLARGFRAPGIPELASNGAHEGTTRYEYGDNTLKSETSLQMDGAVEFNTEHFSLNLSAFYNSFNNFIFYRKLSSVAGGDSIINIDGTDLAAFKFQQQQAVLNGFEATLDIHPHPLDWLHIENTFSLVNGRLNEAIEDSKNLPFIPAPRLITELRGNFKKVKKHIHNLYIKAELDNTFTQDKIFTAYNTETRTPGYTLLNAGIGADLVTGKEKTLFSIHLSGINLLDIAYQNHLSRLKYAPANLATGRTGIYNMGRNFSIRINIPLSFVIKQ